MAAPPPESRFERLLRGELLLLETEERGSGLVKPMFLLPPVLPPEETVIFTGEEEDVVFTMFIGIFKEQRKNEKVRIERKKIRFFSDTLGK